MILHRTLFIFLLHMHREYIEHRQESCTFLLVNHCLHETCTVSVSIIHPHQPFLVLSLHGVCVIMNKVWMLTENLVQPMRKKKKKKEIKIDFSIFWTRHYNIFPFKPH